MKAHLNDTRLVVPKSRSCINVSFLKKKKKMAFVFDKQILFDSEYAFLKNFYSEFQPFLYARRRRDVLWDHPWWAGGVQFFVRSISPKLLLLA